MSLVDSGKNNGNAGVGNYKGVMLCNRPFAGSASKMISITYWITVIWLHLFLAGASKLGGNSGDKNPFSCGVVPETVGTNVSIANMDKVRNFTDMLWSLHFSISCAKLASKKATQRNCNYTSSEMAARLTANKRKIRTRIWRTNATKKRISTKGDEIYMRNHNL